MTPSSMPPSLSCCAIIPARGGSKGIPGKNVRIVGGKPMIAHTIEAARAAERVDRVFVSTDDAEIARVAREWGAEVVERPAELATDTASSESALLHTLAELEASEGYRPELLVFLQCTSPLTTSGDIDGTVAALVDEEADTSLAVTPFHYFVWKHGAGGDVVGVNHDKSVRPMRQEREAQWLETGAVYVMRAEGFKEAKHRFFGKTALFEMPADRVAEIDEPEDLARVEARMAVLSRGADEARLPERVDALVMDFDGVLTDDKVLVREDGLEAVTCSRSDGYGLERLRGMGVRLAVISKEKNPVVEARCKKLKVECYQGIDDKLPLFSKWAGENDLSLSNVVYIGNDLTDIPCIRAAGAGVTPADARPEARAAADLVLGTSGGQGAVRELCELIARKLEGRK